jgi:hypothetical protein
MELLNIIKINFMLQIFGIRTSSIARTGLKSHCKVN